LSWAERGDLVYNTLLATAQRSQAQVRAYLDARRIPYQSFIIDNSIYIPGAAINTVNDLTLFADVGQLRLERVYPVPDVRLEPDLPQITAVEWGVSKINADDVWGLGYTGGGIVVANIDTGVRYTHQALINQYRGNLGGGSYNHTYSWSDPTGTYPSAPGDNNGHGSHTMGTMVGSDGGSNQIGVAPGARWIACKGCSSTSCSDSTLNACADWMLAPGGTTSMRPHIVNNSWGGCTYDNWYRTKVTAWQAAGIYPVFSAGNTSNCGYSSAFCGSVGTPATYREVTAVGSTTSTDAISSFSLWGPSQDPYEPNAIKPEVSAPGSTIRSAYYSGDTTYYTMSGTSMAAPHVSGALALIWSACPALVGNLDTTEQLLQDRAVKIAYATGCGNEGAGNIPNNAFGYGRIDVLAAVNACANPGPTPTPTNTPTPTPVQPILLVDDDNGSTYQTYYTAALAALGRSYDTWTVSSQGSPSAATLQAHQIVIWFTGNDYSTTLTSTDESNLAAYLNGGGKLFITGQDIGYDISTGSFYATYLHASYVADDTNVTTLTGTDIMAGANVSIAGGDGANNQTYPSAIGLGTGAVGLYDYDGTTYTWGALRWEGAYKVVYFSFGFEAINAAASRATVMQNVLNWLEGGAPPPTPTYTPTNPPPTPTYTPTSPPPTPTFTPTPPPSGDLVWLSLTANAALGTLGTVNDEDIVALDLATGVYSWVFDGSDVGITGDIDAFDLLDNGHILISLDATASVGSLGTVYDSDIIEFTPTSLGATTAGTFSWFFDGSDVGLSSGTEDIDGIYMLPDGTLLVSFRNAFGVTGASGQDEDLIRFTATSWGATTAGTWSWYFDGSDVGLSTSSYEDVDALWLDTSASPYPDVYLSTIGSFAVTGVSGANEDIFVFHPTALGSTTTGTFGPGLYFDGSVFGLSSYDVDAFDVP
jgi:subtilisin family serine protease